jgi:hypothetical protein
MTHFRPGDRVMHNPTGEEWKVVKVHEFYLELTSWPWWRLAKDCTLICGCTTSDERADCNRPCDTVVL